MSKSEIVAWQGRRNWNDPDNDIFWGAWKEVCACDLVHWQQKVIEQPDLYQLRALCVCPYEGEVLGG